MATFSCVLHGECLLTEHDFQRQKVGERRIRKACETCKDKATKLPGEPLNVGVLNQAVYVGGAEVWAATMARFSSHNWTLWSDRPAEPFEGLRVVSDDWLAWRDQQDVLILWNHLASMILPRLDGYAGRVVLLSHGSGEWTRNYMESCAPFADAMVAVSEAAREAFPADVRDKVRVILNGVDLERVKPSKPRDELRAELGIDRTAIVYVGRYMSEKRPEVAALAAEQMGAVAVYRCPDYTLARKELAGKPVIFSPLSVADTLAAVDVLVLASPAEGCALAILEAWAAGIPVVCTQVGGVPEIERDNGVMTVLVPVDPTADDVAAACLEAVARREELIAAGLAYSAKYAAKEMAAEWDKLLAVG